MRRWFDSESRRPVGLARPEVNAPTRRGMHCLSTWECSRALGIGLGLTLAMALAPGASAQQNPVTAIDIALEPDATMIQHAMAANARLLKSFPKGFSLDATHHPHVSLLQQFVRTDDLDKIYAAAQ